MQWGGMSGVDLVDLDLSCLTERERIRLNSFLKEYEGYREKPGKFMIVGNLSLVEPGWVVDIIDVETGKGACLT